MDHQDDPREAVYSWERLYRGQTGDTLWDVAQKSLLIHGELHNNVRMTWGKTFLNWTRHPQDALDLMIDLNHRFALDGNDPNSYGGLLWCLGLFDRPFKPERPVIGTLRPRSTKDHAKRLKNRWILRLTLPSFTNHRSGGLPEIIVNPSALRLNAGCFTLTLNRPKRHTTAKTTKLL
jgi:deoxyribodipyrimidine photolyase